MILDRLQSLEKYAGTIPHTKEIAEFLKDHDAATLPCGRYDVCDGVFVNVCDIENGENSVYEAHRKYNDLQCLITGDEIMKRCHIADCGDATVYADDGDCQLFRSAESVATLHVRAGEFAYFDPDDAHAPGTAGDVKKVRKLIFKIPV